MQTKIENNLSSLSKESPLKTGDTPLTASLLQPSALAPGHLAAWQSPPEIIEKKIETYYGPLKGV